MVLPFLGFMGILALMGIITGLIFHVCNDDFDKNLNKFFEKKTEENISSQDFEKNVEKEYKTVYIKNPNTGIAYATQIEVKQKAIPKETTINGVTTLPNGVTIRA